MGLWFPVNSKVVLIKQLSEAQILQKNDGL